MRCVFSGARNLQFSQLRTRRGAARSRVLICASYSLLDQTQNQSSQLFGGHGLHCLIVLHHLLHHHLHHVHAFFHHFMVFRHVTILHTVFLAPHHHAASRSAAHHHRPAHAAHRLHVFLHGLHVLLHQRLAFLGVGCRTKFVHLLLHCFHVLLHLGHLFVHVH